jgi:hypothetical protein
MSSDTADERYRLRISRRTIDQLGVKLYDRVALVISELISNAYDADAPTVSVAAPAGQFLATRKATGIEDKGFTIQIADSGFGMNPQQLRDYYLVVGSDRRTDARGATSPKGRPVMGRKGVGKLAPFGICKTIEVISSGVDNTGKAPANKPYLTSHIILEYDGINTDKEADYFPKTGDRDKTFAAKSGTVIILRDFLTRKVPSLEDLAQEVSQRFGKLLDSGGFVVTLTDNFAEPPIEHEVSALDLPGMPDTRINFEGPLPSLARADQGSYRTSHESGQTISLLPGFECGGKFLPVVGWIGYSKEPVKQEIAAGIRIYCRKKFAAQTLAFDTPSGFTGEFQVKAYLIGELHCDWLDEEEDLIHTDRQNIQWSSDVGSAFREWGRTIVRDIAKNARRPAAETTLDLFKKTVDLDVELAKRFPSKAQDGVKRRAKDVIETLARKMAPVDAKDRDAAMEIVSLATAFAPHMELSEELTRAAASSDLLSIGTVASILSSAKLAEAMTLGTIAEKRLKIIEQFKTLVHATPSSSELELQKLIEQAPWLIRPEWTPISENKGLKRVKDSLERFLSNKAGREVVLSTISNPTKRPDFVLIGAEGPLRLVEIKKPQHDFNKDDFDRFWPYVDALDEFFADAANASALAIVQGYEITLVADGINLPSFLKSSLENLKNSKKLIHVKWDVLIDHTKTVHEDFLSALDQSGLAIPNVPGQS